MPGRLLDRLGRAWAERPLTVVLVAAVAARLLSVAFSRGFAFYDDHFSVIEVAQRWVDGHRDWLDDPTALRSPIYPGLHWLLFEALEAVGVRGPGGKMLVVRVLHAAWSLLTVYYGYLAARALSDERRARVVGLLLALFWLAPSMSVRNLIEVVAQPPLMAALWLLVRGRGSISGRDAIAAGALFGVAFVIRFPVAAMPAAVFAWLLATRQPRAALGLAAGAAVSTAVLQGGSDWIVYGRPFSSVIAYLTYNATPANVAAYPQGPWFQYIGLIAGVLLPPLGLAFLYGFLRGWRRFGVAFWPAVAFIALHSAYPNKQERFIFPVLPYVLLVGVLGWYAVADGVRWWTARPRLRRGLWTAFWAINTALYFLVGMNDWKRSRTLGLQLLSDRPDVRGVVVAIDAPKLPDPPLFYIGREVPVFKVTRDRGADELGREIAGSPGPPPNYVVFLGEARLAPRVAEMATVLGPLEPVGRVDPSLIDALLRRANPKYHVNLPSLVYRVSEPR